MASNTFLKKLKTYEKCSNQLPHGGSAISCSRLGVRRVHRNTLELD